MEMTIKGTPKEIREFLATGGQTAVVKRPIVEGAEGPEKFVTVNFARHVLGRRPVSEQLKALLDTLNDAGTEFVPVSELYDATGYSFRQFAGMLGALGRRMANTPGYDEEAEFFDWRWNKGEKEWEYRLPDTVREALASNM